MMEIEELKMTSRFCIKLTGKGRWQHCLPRGQSRGKQKQDNTELVINVEPEVACLTESRTDLGRNHNSGVPH